VCELQDVTEPRSEGYVRHASETWLYLQILVSEQYLLVYDIRSFSSLILYATGARQVLRETVIMFTGDAFNRNRYSHTERGPLRESTNN
jgi:hypothetical protein